MYSPAPFDLDVRMLKLHIAALVVPLLAACATYHTVDDDEIRGFAADRTDDYVEPTELTVRGEVLVPTHWDAEVVKIDLDGDDWQTFLARLVVSSHTELPTESRAWRTVERTWTLGPDHGPPDVIYLSIPGGIMLELKVPTQ